MAVTHLSPSAAGTWAQCPRRWWYRYVDGLPEPPPGEPAVLGSFVHRILELLLAEAPEDRTPDRARLLARFAWGEVSASEEWDQLELDDDGALRFRQRAWSTVEAYFRLQDPTAVRPVAQELRVEVEVDGVPFKGFIDLVEEHPGEGDGPPKVVITDYKTGRPPEQGKPWSDERIREKLLQPQWYAAAVDALGEHEPVRARLLYFTALDDADGRSHRLETAELGVDVDDAAQGEAVAELQRRWHDIGEALAAGSAEPSPGPLCGWCPYVALCEAGQAECERRWSERDRFTGGRRLRDDAPAVELLGLATRQAQTA